MSDWVESTFDSATIKHGVVKSYRFTVAVPRYNPLIEHHHQYLTRVGLAEQLAFNYVEELDDFMSGEEFFAYLSYDMLYPVTP